MKSIEELQADVKKLYQELEERKKMEQTAAPQTVNFREISSKAQRYAIQGHPMKNCDEHIQQMYLLVLLSVASLDDTAYIDSFCTIYRIAHGMNYNGDIQELFLSAQQMNFDKLDECTRLFLNNEKRLLLLLECMLVAGSFEAGRKKAMEYIAQLSMLMKITKEEIIFLSNLARVILTQDIHQYQCKIMNTYETLFDCYLKMVEKQFEFKTVKILAGDFEKIEVDYEKSEVLFTVRKTLRFFAIENEAKYEIIRYTYPKNNIIYYESCENINKYISKCVSKYIQNIQGKNNQRPDNVKAFASAFESIFEQAKVEYPVLILTNSPLAYGRASRQLKECLNLI